MKTYTLLIADDYPENLQAIVEALKDSVIPFKIIKAINGKILCELAEKRLPDLIITDWEMPEMDGIEAIRHLKSQPSTADIPIIMCTGIMTSSDSLKLALDSGAVDYVRKPVDKIELQARVHAMLKLADSYRTIKEQNIVLEQQKQEIEIQKVKLEKTHKHITDSIHYANRIQNALLPYDELLTELLPNHFILYKPKDIVSGDFYWVRDFSKYVLIAAADCTGHGVPGAFMSMLGITIFNEIITRRNANMPAQILHELRTMLKKLLKQTGKSGESQDGMDIALCSIDKETNKLMFAGAHNPCWIFRQQRNIPDSQNPEDLQQTHLIELSADQMPVGIFTKERPFSDHTFQLLPNDLLYIFSDGFQSQFGGEKDEKYKTKHFKELLSEIHQLPMNQQKDILEQKFVEWKGNKEQTDDVLVIGVRI
jgi:CheY-like chemotaxis protein